MLDLLKKLLVDKEVKICTKCNKLKLIEDFSKCNSNKDGYQSYCKECFKQYRESNKSAYVYLVYQGKECMYIGSTVNLKARLSNHLNCHSNLSNYMKKNTWTEIKYIEFEDITREELYLIEDIFVENIMPSLNQAKISYNLDENQLEEVSMLAYETLENHQELAKVYRRNYSIVD